MANLVILRVMTQTFGICCEPETMCSEGCKLCESHIIKSCQSDIIWASAKNKGFTNAIFIFYWVFRSCISSSKEMPEALRRRRESTLKYSLGAC